MQQIVGVGQPFKTAWSALYFIVSAFPVLAADTPQLTIPAETQRVLRTYCSACHGADVAEGQVRFDQLERLTLQDRLELLNKVQQQLMDRLMPPLEADQVPEVARRQLNNWVAVELDKHNASRMKAKLAQPEFGNYVDHDQLFSGEFKHLKAFTYDRRWLISEYIFDARFNQLLNHRPFQTIDGKRRFVIGDNNRRVNLTNPFLLPTRTGVRYYANTTLNGGHLLTMITNVKEVAAYMVHLTKRDRRYAPAIQSLMEREWEHARILTSRETFLNRFIVRVLHDLYPQQHQALLPKFVPVVVPSPVSASGKPIKKSPFHAAQPGSAELVVIFQTMQRHQQEGDTDQQLISKCEREWFHFGHNPRTIQRRVVFLRNYMPEWRDVIVRHRYARRHKIPEYRPLSSEEMQIVRTAILRHRKRGDRYSEIIAKCMADWAAGFERDRIAAGSPSTELLNALVEQLFVKIHERDPTAQELAKYSSLMRTYIESLGRLAAIEKLIQTLILRSEFVYRYEFGQGQMDGYGRRKMSARDASYAIAYALTDSSPDESLVQAASQGRLQTRDDYRREVERLLNNREQYYVIDEAVQRIQLTASITNTPIRKLRFFREFFGYPKLLPVFKDNKRFGGNYDRAKGRLVGEADRLVDHILQKDQRVFEELLSTEKFYVYHSGDNQAMAAASQRIRKIYDHFKDLNWQDFEAEDLKPHQDFIQDVRMRGMGRNPQSDLRTFKTVMTSLTTRFDKGQSAAAPFDSFPAHGKSNADTRTGMQLRSPEVAKFFNIQLDNWNYPTTQPARVAHRKGMLTHPAWLIAHAANTETDPVKRGKWIREKLLAGTVPDVPITVDAVIPEDHHKTLRTRLVDVTEKRECWKCHIRMNPLGYAFEMYDDFGRFRTEESLEHPDNLIKKGPDKAAPHVDLRDTYKTLPVNPAGHLAGTGDTELDGDVENAIDLIERLAKSRRVRQSIIRYAFRYFMGRNEMLSDSKTLIDAEQEYVSSGGSFDAVIVSLLTSDSFMYRKPIENEL